MAILCKQGKLLLSKLIIPLIFWSFLYFLGHALASDLDPCSNSDEADVVHQGGIDETPDAVLVRKHELQLEKLEALVGQLGQLIARLESQFDESRSKTKGVIRDSVVRTDDEALVVKYNALWNERFHFLSAVKLKTPPSCVNLFPRGPEGFSKYFAVGDGEGKVHVFSRSGDLVLELNTFLGSTERSRITAMASYSSIYKNETRIVTGHEDGSIIVFRVWESPSSEELSSPLLSQRVVAFTVPESSLPRISLLEVHHVGRKKHILARNEDGKIFIFFDDGKLHGAAAPTARPIAFVKQRLLFLTGTGAGSLDLRTMKIRESECEGLNSSLVESYVFDAMDRSKAYGITSEGDLIQTVLLGDAINFKCRIRSSRKLDLSRPVAIQTIKGYLLITDSKKVMVYNISSQHYVRGNGLKLMFSTSIDEIASLFLHQNVHYIGGIPMPLIASDGDKDIIIHLGNGYVGLYASKLPVLRSDFNSILWTSPVLFFILFLFGAWHFFASKKEALTSWGPDDPFGSSNGSPSASYPSDDAAGNAEIVELRGSGLRSSSSRYVTTAPFVGGEGSSFRQEVEASPVADPRFSELKFRGSSVEGVKRRDSLFGSSQGVKDSS